MLWLGWPWWRQGLCRLRAAALRRRARRRAGEPWHWRAWRREARRDSGTLSAFYRWLALAAGAPDLRGATATLDEAAQGAAAAALRDAYGRAPARAGWRVRLGMASRQWRGNWRARRAAAPAHGLPGSQPRARRARKLTMDRHTTEGWRRWAARLGAAAMALLLAACAAPRQQAASVDELPSWNDGPSRTAIVEFVRAVTRSGGPDFVAADERIAVFDNDGTLWSEQPMYFQMLFALDRVKSMAPRHPDWARRQPFKAALQDDHAALAKGGDVALMKIVGATHTDMSTDTFTRSVRYWASTARHPRFDRLYTELTFAPMRELLDYLRAHGFKTYIVSGGETEFMRSWTQQAYGIPPEQVIGSSFVTTYGVRDGEPTLWRHGKLEFNDDGPGKPVAIQRYIGRRPILAFGNSDGDLQMLQWTAAGDGKRFAGLVHHTDAQREWAYDRDSRIGRLDRALDEARRQDWTVVDMKTEWKRVYAFEQP